METVVEVIRQKVAVSTQVAVAHELGITQAMVSRVLSGKAMPGRKVLVGVMNAWPEYEAEAIASLRMTDESAVTGRGGIGVSGPPDEAPSEQQEAGSA